MKRLAPSTRTGLTILWVTAALCACKSDPPPALTPDTAPWWDETPACYQPGADPATGLTWQDVVVRDDREAETLALEATRSFIADDQLYETVRTDLMALRATFDDELLAIDPEPCWYASMRLEFDATVDAQAFRDGSYYYYTGLNERFGVSDVRVYEGSRGATTVTLHFRRNYWMPTLWQIYADAGLPGLYQASYSGVTGDGPDLCLELDGEDRYYLFDDASGDCFVGCGSHQYSGYRVDRSGNLEHLGTHDRRDEVQPPWFMALEVCREFL
jgi:hypothetical protein